MYRRLGGNREIVSCRAVRAYAPARGAWSSEISAKSSDVLFPFSLMPRPAFPFSLLPRRPFPFPLRPPPPPNPATQLQLALSVYIYIHFAIHSCIYIAYCIAYCIAYWPLLFPYGRAAAVIPLWQNCSASSACSEDVLLLPRKSAGCASAL